jgi:ABC-2 type transport system ATP-binding protein
MVAFPVAEFRDVVKDYPTGLLGRGSLRAVSSVSLRLEAGEVFGLLGPNRAGKTTLVKLLLSLARPTLGQVVRLGHPARNHSTLARVGYVHENPAFPRYLTARELLHYYGALTLMDEPRVCERTEQLLEMVGLADRSAEPIARFSKGMTQRLGLAQALLNEPDLLVLDEPAEGLDLLGRQLVRRVVTEQRQRGRTVLLVSHHVQDVDRLCDRIGVLVKGRLAYVGPPSGLSQPSGNSPSAALEKGLQDLYEKD